MSLGDLWARLPPPLGLGILSKLRSQLELQQVPSKSAGPPHLDLTKYLVGGLWAGSALPWDTVRVVPFWGLRASPMG